MNPTRWGALALCAAAALAAAVPLVLAPRSAAGGEYGAGPHSFPHQPHLSAETVAAALADAAATDRTGRGLGGGGKADRECRACHDYARDASAHLTSCGRCHVEKGSTKHLEVVLAAPPAASAFPHAEHLKDPSVTCFSCHRVRKEMGWLEFTIPAGGLGAAGAAGRPGGTHGEFTCTDCHAAHEPLSRAVPQYARTGDGRACAECHGDEQRIVPRRLRPARGDATAARGTFRHADHGGADRACDECHAEIRASRTIWDHDPVAATAAACERCHVDAERRPLVGVSDPPRTTRLPSTRFSRFPHDRHLAAPEGKIETSGKVTDACRTCHYPERDAAAAALFPGRKPSAEPAGRAELVDYDACTPCHAAWKVEGHGVGAWACFKCHAMPATSEGKLPLARASVVRTSLEGGVRFTAHHHPGVSRKGGALADAKEAGGKTCRDCHTGDVQALATRLTDRRARFLHDPHLPAEPRNADCLACHSAAAEAAWSRDMQRFDPHLDAPVTASGATGGARGCLACHAGATPEQLGLSTAVRDVPEFDHKGHLATTKWEGGAGIPCRVCHEPGGETGYSIPRDVADCSRCHAHDEKDAVRFARTGKASSSPEDAKACVHCHDDLAAQTAPAPPAPRRHLSLLPGTQHHDETGACASCHAREGRAYSYSERITKARVAVSIHEDRALCDEWFNDPKIALPGGDPQGRSCRTCHSAEPRGYLRALGGR